MKVFKEKIAEIYKRRQKAHDELLACDIEVDKLLRHSQIALLKEMPVEKRENEISGFNEEHLENNGYNQAIQELTDWRDKKIEEIK